MPVAQHAHAMGIIPHDARAYFFASGQISGSGARSPSMLNNPSTTINLPQVSGMLSVRFQVIDIVKAVAFDFSNPRRRPSTMLA